MKLKRNDQCYCGSGKKYKKCCMNKIKSTFTIPIEESESAFEYIADTSVELAQILSKYDVKDVSKAVFCINAWPRNRSALAQTLTLNHALITVKDFGEEKINSYSTFVDFYEDILKYLEITPYEDLTLCDFGEVQITIDNISYPIILGTGHEQVFGVMNFIDQLSKVTDKERELKTILEYNKLIINMLSGNDLNNGIEQNEIVFEIPNQSFWNRINNLFELKQFNELKENVYTLMGHVNGPIEMRHFFQYEKIKFPLFNSSLLIDFYKKLLSTVDEEKYMQHINLTIWRILENTFNKDSKSHPRVLIAPKLFDIKNNIPYSDNKFCFAVKLSKTVLLAVNEGDFKDVEDVNEELKKFTDLLKINELNLLETYYRKEIQGGYAFNITSDIDIKIIHVKPITDISTQQLILGQKSDRFICTALDLIYFLYSIEDFEELVEFINYSEKDSAKLFIMGGKSSLYYSWKKANQQISSGAIDYNMVFIEHGSADDYIYSYYKKNLIDYPFNVDSNMFAYPYEWHVSENEFGYSTFTHKGLLGFGGEMKKFGESKFLFLAHNIEFFKPTDLNTSTYTNIRTIEELNQRLFNSYGETIFSADFFENKVIQIMYMPNYYAKQVDHNGFTKRPDVKNVYSDINVMGSSIIIRYTVEIENLMRDIMESKNREVECNYLVELIEPLGIYIAEYFEGIKRVILKDIKMPKQVGVFSIEQDYYVSDEMIDFKMDSVNFAKVRKTIAQVCYEKGIQAGTYIGKKATKVIRKMQQTLVDIFENQIKDYSQNEFHLMILSYYSEQLHQSIVNLKRYSSFKDIDPQILQEFETRTRKERENNRRNIRMAQYLLETNLAINHSDKNLSCNKKDFETLLAFADWLVVLQDNADNCYYNELDVEIQIDSEYKVDTVFSQYSDERYEELFRRKYNQKDYSHKNDDKDKQYLLDAIRAFETDTNIDFNIFISLLEYLQLDVAYKDFSQEIAPSIFEIKKSELYSDFISLLTIPSEINEVEKILDFIIIDKSKLKYLNEKSMEILPFWEREKRDNRFDVKPVLSLGDTIIVSTVLVKQLATY